MKIIDDVAMANDIIIFCTTTATFMSQTKELVDEGQTMMTSSFFAPRLHTHVSKENVNDDVIM